MRIKQATLGIAAITLVSACTGGTVAQSGDKLTDEGKKIVKFLTAPPEDSEDEAVAKRLIKMFEERHPNIDVQRSTLPTEQLRTVLQTKLRSGTGPDVFAYDTGPGYAGVLAEAGLLYNLTQAYRKRDWQIYDWAKERVTFNGKVLGVPDQVEQLGIFYNKNMFRNYGLQPPRTLQELHDVARVLKSKGKIPFAFGNKEQWPASHLFSMAVSNTLGPEGLQQVLFGKASWDQPEVEQAIDVAFREFAERGYYPSGANSILYDQANDLFYSGKAAMLPTGSWLVSQLNSATKSFEVGFIPFPSIQGSPVAPPTGLGSGLFMSSHPRNPKAAIEFLDYMQSKAAAEVQVVELQKIPAHPVNTKDLSVSPLFQEMLDDLVAASEEGLSGFGYNIDVLAPAKFNDTMYSGFQLVLGGSRSPQGQAKKLQASWANAE